jgi:hypothetical protein
MIRVLGLSQTPENQIPQIRLPIGSDRALFRGREWRFVRPSNRDDVFPCQGDTWESAASTRWTSAPCGGTRGTTTEERSQPARTSWNCVLAVRGRRAVSTAPMS